MSLVHAPSGAGRKMDFLNSNGPRWIKCALRNQAGQIALLILALLPSVIVAVMAMRIWLSGDVANYAWQSKIWLVVILQVASIAAFWVHAGSNKRLASGELGGWVLQFIVYIPFGMISYWGKHVWGKNQ